MSGHVRPLPGGLRPGAAPRPFQVADPFHVVRLANRCVDLVRRRVQNETLGAPRTEESSALSDQAPVDHGV